VRGSAQDRAKIRAVDAVLRLTRLSEPVYSRLMNSRGESMPSLGGLGPGRYRIEMGTNNAGIAAPDRIVELDGQNDVELVFDLR